MRRALLLGAVLVLLVGVGLAGAELGKQASEEERRSAPVPMIDGTPVETLHDCPWGEALCILAIAVERAMERGNVDAILGFSRARLYDCPAQRPESGGPYPLCGTPANELRPGFAIAVRHGDNRVVDPQGMRDAIREFAERIDHGASDEVGPGAPRVYALSCTQRAFPIQNVSCARAGIVISAIVRGEQGPERRLIVFWSTPGSVFQFGFGGRGLVISELAYGAILEEELPVLFETGGFLPDLGEIHVLQR